MRLAPIILFVYNRPRHTEQVLKALSLNKEAAESILYIYADGAKENDTEANIKNINKTRALLQKKQWCKEVKIITSEKNKGLANSIIDATTEIVNRHQRVITLEDDVIVGRFFLSYMNQALELYEKSKEVFMVSGYNFPAPEFPRKHSCFFLPVGTSQAWGTWKKKWDLFDIEAKGYERIKDDAALRREFNLDNSHDFASMLEAQMETGNINSWAIRYRWSLFMKKGLTLFPDQSLVKNIGWDGSGTHSGKVNPYKEKDWKNDYMITGFPQTVFSDPTMLEFHKIYLKRVAALPATGLKPRIRRIFGKAILH